MRAERIAVRFDWIDTTESPVLASQVADFDSSSSALAAVGIAKEHHNRIRVNCLAAVHSLLAEPDLHNQAVEHIPAVAAFPAAIASLVAEHLATAAVGASRPVDSHRSREHPSEHPAPGGTPTVRFAAEVENSTVQVVHSAVAAGPAIAWAARFDIEAEALDRVVAVAHSAER